MSLKTKIAIIVAVVSMAALAPSLASAAANSVSICDVECSTFDCWFAHTFMC